MLDAHVCYTALKARDARFDGRLFVGVTTTGIYCRPVCPAGPARFENCRFYPSAAAAQVAGFRPCLRCRPETVLDLGSGRGTLNSVSRGLALIAGGALDGDDAGLEVLAARLGVSGRHLRRLFQQHLGASPIAVLQTRRVLFAKQLLHETRLPMMEVALAAGFGSVRRFNEAFQRLFGRPPSVLRREGAGGAPPGHPGSHGPPGSLAATGVTVHLRYRAPLDWEALHAYLRTRAIAGMERVDGGRYARTMVQDGVAGTFEITHVPEASSLAATIRVPNVRALSVIVARLRHMFDLGADVMTIGAHLARDPMLAPLVAERPGLRVPGGWDTFEIAARAVLGQQVTVEAGRQFAERLAWLCGSRVPVTETGDPALTLTFPSAAEVLSANLGAFGIPRARKQALVALAKAAIDDPHMFESGATVEQTVARLLAISGIGPWTAQYIALRAAREPDAFPATDAALRRGAARRGATRPDAAELTMRAERWRPWRAYAAQHLWAADAASRSTQGVSR